MNTLESSRTLPSSSLIDPAVRERRAAATFERWPADVPGALIGGYAETAHGSPCYSEDIDIVVTTLSRDQWEHWLHDGGLEKDRGRRNLDGDSNSLEVSRWVGKDIPVDLMVGGVRDRDSGVVIPGDWILGATVLLHLELLSGPIRRKVPTVRIEGLWALKLCAGRPLDLTDLFAASRLLWNESWRSPEVREGQRPRSRVH